MFKPLIFETPEAGKIFLKEEAILVDKIIDKFNRVIIYKINLTPENTRNS